MKYQITERCADENLVIINLINSMNIKKSDIDRIKKDYFNHFLICSNKEMKLHCTICNKTFASKRKYKHKEEVNCPKCGASVQAALQGYFSTWQEGYITTFHKHYKSLVALTHRFSMRVSKPNLDAFTVIHDEIVSACVFDTDVQRFFTNTYYFGWKEEENIVNRLGQESVSIDIITLQKASESTQLKYIKEYLMRRAGNSDNRRLLEFINLFYKYPQTEFLLKMGFENLVIEKADKWKTYRALNWKKSKISEMLGINDKSLIKHLACENAGHREIAAVKRALKEGWFPKNNEELKKIMSIDLESPMLLTLKKNITLKKYSNYKEKQRLLFEENKRHFNFERYYKDYIRQAKLLDYNVTDLYYGMPPNLIKAHDKVTEEYAEVVRREMLAAQKERLIEDEKNEKQFKREVEKLQQYNYKNEDFEIVVAKEKEELSNEGLHLHHCVASYFKRMAKGQGAIFFIREAEKKEIPFFTLELEPKRKEVMQVRGKYNCSPNEEVQNFVNEWIGNIKGESRDGK